LAGWTNADEQKNAPELPIGRFHKSKSLGGNRVILVVTRRANDGDSLTVSLLEVVTFSQVADSVESDLLPHCSLRSVVTFAWSNKCHSRGRC
jgi:hypothetical protein